MFTSYMFITSITYGQVSFQGLGDLPGGDFHSEANAVSGDGKVIVGASYSEFGFEAFQWVNGTMTGLGDLPGGEFLSAAEDVSMNGDIIVGSSVTASDFRGFRWKNNLMEILDPLPGDARSFAFGISADGSVVVGRSESSPFRSSFPVG